MAKRIACFESSELKKIKVVTPPVLTRKNRKFTKIKLQAKDSTTNLKISPNVR